MIKVSVIIPVYGAESTIEKCAISLFSQTLQDIEYIFVDDCSPDNSISVLNSVLDRFPERRNQVKIKKHTKNRGVAAARQTGLNESDGQYIIHCDPDDWIAPDMYECLYAATDDGRADLVISGYNKVIEDKAFTIQAPNTCSPIILLGYLSGRSPQALHGALWNKLIKKSLCNKVNFEYGINFSEDFLFLWKILLQRPIINHTDYAGYYYNVNPNSITNNFNVKNIKSETNLIKALEKVSPDNNFPDYSKCLYSAIAAIIYNRVIRFKDLTSTDFDNLFGKYKNTISYNKTIGLLGKTILNLAYNINFKFAQTIFFLCYKFKALIK